MIIGWRAIDVSQEQRAIDSQLSLAHQYAYSDRDEDDENFTVVGSLESHYYGGAVSNESFPRSASWQKSPNCLRQSAPKHRRALSRPM